MKTDIKPLPGFEAWLEENQMEIEQVQELLSDKMSDNPAVLYDQLVKIEAWHSRMTSLLADANAYLDLAERAALTQRSERETDLDRKVRQTAAVVNERRLRDILDGVCESIRTRLMLGMSLRKQNAGERSDWAA